MPHRIIYWPLTGWHLVQRGVDWAGPQPAQAPPRCTKGNKQPINSQCTNHRFSAVLMCFKGLCRSGDIRRIFATSFVFIVTRKKYLKISLERMQPDWSIVCLHAAWQSGRRQARVSTNPSVFSLICKLLSRHRFSAVASRLSAKPSPANALYLSRRKKILSRRHPPEVSATAG